MLVAAIASVSFIVAGLVTLTSGTPESTAAPTNITHVQSKHGYIDSGNSMTLRLPNAATKGDLLAVWLLWSNTGGATVSDHHGDAFAASAARTTWGSNFSAQLVYAKNVAGGTTAVTAKFATPVNFVDAYVDEYAGVDPVNPLDTATTTVGSASTMTSGAITTHTANDLIYGAAGSLSSWIKPGTGFVARSTADNNLVEDKLAGAAGSYTATATHGGGTYVMHAAAFRPRGGTTTTTTPTPVTSSSSSTTTSAAASPSATTSTTTTASTSTPAPSTSSTSTAATTSSTAAPSSSTTTASSGTRTCPAFPSFPDASCTGVPSGQALMVVSNDVTYDSSYNGKTISNMDFHGWVTVTGSGITFKNDFFRGRAATSDHGLLDTEASTGTITVQDSTFVPSNPSAYIDGAWARNTNFYRVNIGGGVDGLKANSNTLVQDSYIHDMNWFASDPNQGGGETHNDGAQTFASEKNVTLRHNRIDLSMVYHGNSAWQGSGYNSLAEYNYLDGGGCTINFDAKSLPSGSILQPMYVNNNHFGRHQSFTGCVALISNNTRMTSYVGNVWQDTGAAVPMYQQHD